jgi:hypothetical protein
MKYCGMIPRVDSFSGVNAKAPMALTMRKGGHGIPDMQARKLASKLTVISVSQLTTKNITRIDWRFFICWAISPRRWLTTLIATVSTTRGQI